MDDKPTDVTAYEIEHTRTLQDLEKAGVRLTVGLRFTLVRDPAKEALPDGKTVQTGLTGNLFRAMILGRSLTHYLLVVMSLDPFPGKCRCGQQVSKNKVECLKCAMETTRRKLEAQR